MAGRKPKSTVDYFPHFVKHGKTMFILQSRFGNNGYAFWFKLLEILSANINHIYDCRNTEDAEYMSALMQLPYDICVQILNLLAKLNAIDPELWTHKLIWCQNLVDHFDEIYQRRMNKKPEKPIVADINPISVNINPISDDINTQTKLKETKLNNESNKLDSPLLDKSKTVIMPRKLYEFYVDNNQYLRKVRAYTIERQKHCSARCSAFNRTSDPIQAFADWCKAITMAQDIPFLRGENDRSWKADLDWFIINGTNYHKVLEGKYSNDNSGAADRVAKAWGHKPEEEETDERP